MNTKESAPASARRLVRAVGTAVVAMTLLASAAAFAQSSSIRTVSVPFAGPGGGDGYESGSIGVTYAFIACQGEMHIAYSLDEGSATASSTYRLGGTAYPATGAPPQPVTIRFAGTVYRGPQPVGSFADGLTGKALGMGCFTGQTQKFANIVDVVGPKATADQVTNYFNSLRITVEPANTLRSAAMESRIRGELRRKEAEATAAARKAEQDARAKAEQEAQAKAEQDAQARAQSEAAQQATAGGTAGAPAAATHATPTSSSGSGNTAMPVMPAQPAPPPTQEQRIANAIASDRVLADQRLEQQRAVLAQQQAAMAAAEQQQFETFVAVAPAAMELGGALEDALNAWDARRSANQFQSAQAKLAGKCLMPNGVPVPKDGTIQLGVEMTAKLSKHDCGYNPSNRYKAFKLELPHPTRLRFTVSSAGWRFLTTFQINVLDLSNKSHMFLGWQEWGTLQMVNGKSADLPAGIYVVRVSNGIADTFSPFDLRVDPLGADGRVLPVAAPVAEAAADTPGDAPAAGWKAPVAALKARVASMSKRDAAAETAYLGLTVEAGEPAVVTAVEPGSPAASAGILPGDHIVQLRSDRMGGLRSDVARPRDQSGVDAWLATVRAGAQATIYYTRDGKHAYGDFVLGTRQAD